MFNNGFLVGAFVIGTVLLTGVLLVPGLEKIFQVVRLDPAQLMWVYGLALLQLLKLKLGTG